MAKVSVCGELDAEAGMIEYRQPRPGWSVLVVTVEATLIFEPAFCRAFVGEHFEEAFLLIDMRSQFPRALFTDQMKASRIDRASLR